MKLLYRPHMTPAEGWALVIALPLGQMSSMALPPVVGELRDGFALSYADLGLLLAAFGVARLMSDLPVGSAMARFNPRLVLLIALTVSLVASLIGLVASSAWHVGVARFFGGASSGFSQGIIVAWLVGGASAAGRGRVMALSESLFSATAVVAPLLVGLSALYLSWRAPFALGTAAAVVAFLAVLGWTSSASAREAIQGREAGPTEAPRGWSGLRAGGVMLVVAYLLAFIIFFSRQGLLNTYLPVVGSDRVGLSAFHLGLAFSLVSLVSIGVLFLSGWLSDRVGRRRLVVPGVLVLLASSLSIFLITDEPTFVLVAAIQGFAFFINPVAPSLVGDALTGSLRPYGVAVYRLIGDSAILLAPAIVGLALELWGFEAALLVGVAPTLLVLLAVLWLGGRHRVD